MPHVVPTHTEKAPAAIGPYSQAMTVGEFVFVSGQLGLDPSTMELREGLEGQTRQALENVKAILEATGSALDAVASVDIFLTDMADFAAVNAIYGEYFLDHKPARACVAVAGLPKGGLVEIRCIASKK
ncbi:MAG: 2-iminobutanoate/2-iminopropanoate deaminase [Desulfovibrionales bacterium]|jgi:2-iminobutanoate/2-iminopropanoate deaminase|nr:2-iminobutanoate/2-iminopropanoate deaminase [Desulfovibrionales bacterium]